MKYTLLIYLFLLVSCGRATKQEIIYSNLAGESSQKEIRELLFQKMNHPPAIQTYFEYVEDINQRAISPLVDEFTILNKSSISYSDFVFQTSDNLEINSRIAAYILLGNEIDVEGDCDLKDSYIVDDISFLNNSLQASTEEIEDYACIYSTIPVSNDLGEHIASINSFFETIDLEVSEDHTISLIRIYVHNPSKHLRYIEHAGVLVEKFNDLVFLEKYGSNYPFQVTKFDNRTQLIHYLLDRPTLQSSKALVPLIYENTTLISPTS